MIYSIDPYIPEEFRIPDLFFCNLLYRCCRISHTPYNCYYHVDDDGIRQQIARCRSDSTQCRKSDVIPGLRASYMFNATIYNYYLQIFAACLVNIEVMRENEEEKKKTLISPQQAQHQMQHSAVLFRTRDCQ